MRLDDYLCVGDETADPPEALNGLQVANGGCRPRHLHRVFLDHPTGL
jgi:hypothetical protein